MLRIGFWWTGALIRRSEGLLPKRIVFGSIEGVAKRGRSGNESGLTAWRATPGRSVSRVAGKPWR